MTDEEYSQRLVAGQKKGWIYVVQTEQSGPVKIGWAIDPAKRLRVLQTAQAREIDLIGVLPGTRHLENELHRRLRYARLVGEWFERGAALKMMRPLIRDFGFFVEPVAAESRNSPEALRPGALKKREFSAIFQGVR